MNERVIKKDIILSNKIKKIILTYTIDKIEIPRKILKLIISELSKIVLFERKKAQRDMIEIINKQIKDISYKNETRQFAYLDDIIDLLEQLKR